MSEKWIPVTKRKPEDLEEVIVTWVNKDLDLYFSDMKGKKFSGAAVYCNNRWYWYSRDTQDVLFECGEYKDMLIDDAIEITAWMPFPEPYMEESEDDHMVTISSSLWKSLRAAADYQIPKKSKVVYECSTHLRIRENRCPTCGTCLDKRWDKYCFQCGQRIDWSDGKEE